MVETLYCGHHWDRPKCPDYKCVLNSESPDWRDSLYVYNGCVRINKSTDDTSLLLLLLL